MTWDETGRLSFTEWETLLELIEGAQQPQQPAGAAARKARRQRLIDG